MFNKRRKRKESDNVKEELDLEIKEDYRKKEKFIIHERKRYNKQKGFNNWI